MSHININDRSTIKDIRAAAAAAAALLLSCVSHVQLCAFIGRIKSSTQKNFK